jgi:hypothetical protein
MTRLLTSKNLDAVVEISNSEHSSVISENAKGPKILVEAAESITESSESVDLSEVSEDRNKNDRRGTIKPISGDFRG